MNQPAIVMNTQILPSQGLGEWPQRLLHVPTMISYEWQPGNMYGSHTCPRYNALSYTWGRWRIRDDSNPSTLALKVEQIPWFVPRVQEERFTVEQFERTIHEALTTPTTDEEEESRENVCFLWLDVACIDQRPGSIQGAIEIGRQACIFRNAENAYIWLHEYDQKILEGIFNEIKEAMNDDSEEPIDQAAMLMAHKNLDLLLSDPWFTSLWTLQEAYLCPAARFISQDGMIISVPGPYEPFSMNLYWLCFICATISKSCEQSNEQRIISEQKQNRLEISLFEKIKWHGLDLLAQRTPMSLYTVVQHRSTIQPLDRVYGIMQIFDLRLGKSASEEDSCKEWSLADLEMQLDQKLIEKYPIASQMLVRAWPVPLGQGWRPSHHSLIPGLMNFSSTNWAASHLFTSTDGRIKSQLSTREFCGTTWAYFEGRGIAFEELRAAWMHRCSRMAHNGEDIDSAEYHVSLDRTDLYPQSEHTVGPLDDVLWDRDKTLIQELEALVDHRKYQLYVLHFCTSRWIDDAEKDKYDPDPPKPPTPDFFKAFHSEGDKFGLIVAEASDERGSVRVMRRIGICTWDMVDQVRAWCRNERIKMTLSTEGAKWLEIQTLIG